MTSPAIPPGPATNRTLDPLLIDRAGVAALLGCSERHVYRLLTDGLMPRPVRVGSLVRWRRDELEEWVAHGCTALAMSAMHRRAGHLDGAVELGSSVDKQRVEKTE